MILLPARMGENRADGEDGPVAGAGAVGVHLETVNLQQADCSVDILLRWDID